MDIYLNTVAISSASLLNMQFLLISASVTCWCHHHCGKQEMERRGVCANAHVVIHFDKTLHLCKPNQTPTERKKYRYTEQK